MEEKTQETIVSLKINKTTKKVIAGIVAAILLVGSGYFVGSHSKDDQLEACHKTMNAISDVLNYDGDVSSDVSDWLAKCDPTFK